MVGDRVLRFARRGNAEHQPATGCMRDTIREPDHRHVRWPASLIPQTKFAGGCLQADDSFSGPVNMGVRGASLNHESRNQDARRRTYMLRRIANELLLKLGIRVWPRTVRKYMPEPVLGRPRGDQRWSTFLRNHAQAIVACDFFVAVTATFRQIYVFVVMHHSSRRLLHFNVTKHPTADWTLQQLRQPLRTP